MSKNGINRITRAYNKLIAVMVDPDVQAVFGGERLLSQENELPEIQLDDHGSHGKGSRN